jgi:uncharacterized protein (TIGR02757 family)
MGDFNALLKEFMDEKVDQYQRPEFIESDPIQIPKKYQKREDIEIAGFLTATISWGNRKSILNSAQKMMQHFGNSPYDFVLSSSQKQQNRVSSFVHRTFNEQDLNYFIFALRNVYINHGGILPILVKHAQKNSLQNAISVFKQVFFELNHDKRTEKHISDPLQGSAAKRINMMLRWFVRTDKYGVDLGIWNDQISPSQLSCPLDVHSGNVARQLGLLTRKQNDAKAVLELDTALRQFDPVDPVKYDFALFGIGVNQDLQ